MAAEERAFGWEDEIEKDNDFIALQEGDYDFTIDHYERGHFDGSDKIPACSRGIVFFNVKAEDGRMVTIRESYLLHSRFEWKLSELFCGVGLKKKGEKLRMNWNALPGLTGRAHVTLDQDKKDPGKKYNHIEKIYPKELKSFTPGQF